MDKIKVISALAVAVILATSCNQNGKFTEEIDEVDSLIAEVKTYKARMDSIDQDTVLKMYQVADDQFEYLTNNYPDTSDRKFWINKMSYLGQVRKGYKRHRENEDTYYRTIEESLNQLETLRNSLIDEKLTEEEAERYVADEAEVVARINFFTKKTATSIKLNNVMWDSIRPYFDSVTTYYHSQQ